MPLETPKRKKKCGKLGHLHRPGPQPHNQVSTLRGQLALARSGQGRGPLPVRLVDRVLRTLQDLATAEAIMAALGKALHCSPMGTRCRRCSA